ncbi:MAG: hypothetical protein KAF91_26940 [Nostoc sp. TH1S01]|nr:hypothetical protein [Nostoc sp. TH1S01]
MNNILQSISNVEQPVTATTEVSETVSKKPVESKTVSTKVRSADNRAKIETPSECGGKQPEKPHKTIFDEFSEYIDKLKDDVNNPDFSIDKLEKPSDLNSSETKEKIERVRNKTFSCLTTIRNYIESHIHNSEHSEKLSDLMFHKDIKEILDRTNPYDKLTVLKRMDRKIANDNKTDALLSYEVGRFLLQSLKEDGFLPRQIGRIWS